MDPPPPNLVIEIEVSQFAVPKLPLYAALGIPEVWRWDGEGVSMLRLAGDAYHETSFSLALPVLTIDAVTRFLLESQTTPSTVWTQSVRAWIRAARG